MRLWDSQCIKVAQSYPFEASSNARTDSVSTREQNWDPGDGKSKMAGRDQRPYATWR